MRRRRASTARRRRSRSGRVDLGQGGRPRVVQASATDATSGLAGAGQWTWGDNTAAASGDAVTHTYTQPGTYEVALTVSDAAGNPATAKKTITVGPATTAAGGTTDAARDGGGGGTTTPPRRRRRDDDAPGGDHAARGRWGAADAPSLDLDAPRSARARAKSIPVELTASEAGRVQLALARGTRVIARASVKLDADGTADYRLKLPKGIKAGRYTLKATYRTGHRLAQPHADRQAPRRARARAPSRGVKRSAPDRARSPTDASTAPGRRRTFKVR